MQWKVSRAFCARSHEGDRMYLTSIAPWFGAKRTLARRIIEELGPHTHYCEPFCGSMAVLLRKRHSRMETVNDLHGDLINLARVLASDRAVDLYARCAATLNAECLQAEAREACAEHVEPAESIAAVADVHVARAHLYMIYAWQSRNGSAGTGVSNNTFARRFTANGGSPGLRWCKAVESIPAWHHRLRAVQILRMDAFELIERFEDKLGAVLYVDPPYLVKGTKYCHDLRTEDHDRLATLLARFTETRVAVSYYDHPRLAQLYPAWTKRYLDVTKNLVSAGQRGIKGETVNAPEVLLINGSSLVDTAPQLTMFSRRPLANDSRA